MDQDLQSDDRLGKAALEFLGEVPPPKSALRMRYAAETKVFRDQYGGLESIRQKLGFSRRKMCQLLLVDPSAWTRWMKNESKVPPHIYRSLEWFLALNQKALTHPELASVFLARYGRPQSSELPAGLQLEVQKLRLDLAKQKKVAVFQFASIFILALMCLLQWGPGI